MLAVQQLLKSKDLRDWLQPLIYSKDNALSVLKRLYTGYQKIMQILYSCPFLVYSR